MRKPILCVETNVPYWDIFAGHFMPSFSACGLDGEFSLVATIVGGDAFDYGTDDFRRKMLARTASRAKKISKVAEMDGSAGRMIVFADADIRFYRAGLADELETRLGADEGVVLCACDSPETGRACCGFMAMRAGKAAADFFGKLAQAMEAAGTGDDQDAMNSPAFALRSQIRLLPKTYWTHGYDGAGVWDGKDEVAVPNPPHGLFLHHANHVVGRGNKWRLLDLVRRRVAAGDCQPTP